MECWVSVKRFQLLFLHGAFHCGVASTVIFFAESSSRCGFLQPCMLSGQNLKDAMDCGDVQVDARLWPMLVTFFGWPQSKQQQLCSRAKILLTTSKDNSIIKIL